VRLFDLGARGPEPPVVHDRVLTVANLITLVRLAGLPLFVWLVLVRQAYGLGLLTAAIVGSTDWIDGYVARRFDQVTRVGRFLDPLVDRLLLATAGITLVVAGLAPLWLVGLVVLRDALLLLAIGALFRGAPPIPVNRTGKTATALLMAGLPSFLIAAMDWGGADAFRVAAWVLTVAGAVAYYLAGWQYAVAARAILRARDDPRSDG